MEKRDLKVQKTGHYYLSGNTNGTKLLVALHGYGQLAKYFLRKLENCGEDYLVVAPEGLNHFYTEGFDGRVGASWMTSENREDEIEDYLNYLNRVIESLLSEFNQINEIYILGFSQGSATATRLFCNTDFEVKRLLLWSGMPAHDMPDDVLSRKLNNKLTFVQGSKDSWRPQEKYDQMKEHYSSIGISYREEYFDGGHEISGEVFRNLDL
jgi:predicted esterase